MNYSALADTVEKLIAKYGKTLTLRAYSAATYDPVTMTYTAGTAIDTLVNAVEETYKAFEVDGTHIQAGDIKLMVFSSVVPDTSMKIVIDSVEWAIVAVYPLRPANTTLYYIIQARKP
jgi:hypothetical protein